MLCLFTESDSQRASNHNEMPCGGTAARLKAIVKEHQITTEGKPVTDNQQLKAIVKEHQITTFPFALE